MKRTLIIAVMSLFASLCFSQDVLTGKAINVYDGDTFTLLMDNGTQHKIRVVGIDAPEAKQEYGIVARDYARDLIENKRVTVYCEPGETYGRKLGNVITAEGLHFNYEMVLNGHAWHYEYYNSDKFLKAAAVQAKATKLGLWKNPLAVAPWEYRRNNK